MVRVFFRVQESYGNSPGEVLGLNGPYGKGEKGLKGRPRASPWQVRIGLGRGRRPLSFLLPLLLLPSLPSWKRKGTPTRIGNASWTPLIGVPLLGRPPPPLSFIYVARGHTIDTQVDLLAVCGAPLHSYTPRSYRCGA